MSTKPVEDSEPAPAETYHEDLTGEHEIELLYGATGAHPTGILCQNCGWTVTGLDR